MYFSLKHKSKSGSALQSQTFLYISLLTVYSYSVLPALAQSEVENQSEIGHAKSAVVFSARNQNLSGDYSPLAKALARRHVKVSAEECTRLAGNKLAAIEELTKLRLSDNPALSYQSTKALIEFADDTKVLKTLLSDLDASGRDGLARIIAHNIDRAPSSEARNILATRILANPANFDKSRSLAKVLTESVDLSVVDMAKKKFQSSNPQK